MRLSFNITAVFHGMLLWIGAPSCLPEVGVVELFENAKESADIAKNGLFPFLTGNTHGIRATSQNKINAGSNHASGESCWKNADCESGRCEWGGCKDKLPQGSKCSEDSDCTTNYCTWSFRCEVKGRAGSSCSWDDDCISNECSFRRCTEPAMCDAPLTIPFMITNIEGNHADGDRLLIYEDSLDGPVTVYFLKDVEFCDETDDAPWVLAGTKISSDEFKDKVKSYLTTSDANEVFYVFHGWHNRARKIFMDAYNFNRDHMSTTGYFQVPYHWLNFGIGSGRNIGRAGVPYETDRNTNAIKAGKLIAQYSSVFNTTYTISLMAHSMGNWVLRNFVQNISPIQPFFKNIFMVAADERSDMFSTEFNPSAPPDSDPATSNIQRSLAVGGGRGNHPSTHDIQVSQSLPIPEEELVPDGGYGITQLCNHVHVVWNTADASLAVREKFQFGQPIEVVRALGKYGDSVDYASDTLDYFKERVTYHNFSVILDDAGPIDSHSYEYDQETIDLYVEEKGK